MLEDLSIFINEHFKWVKQISNHCSSGYKKSYTREKIQNNNEKHFEQDAESGFFYFLIIFLR